jgi:hypothetical protein
LRNNILFRGDCVNISSLVNEIIYMSWFWFIDRLRNNIDLTFSLWCNNPLVYFQYTYSVFSLNCKDWVYLLLLIIWFLLIKMKLSWLVFHISSYYYLREISCSQVAWVYVKGQKYIHVFLSNMYHQFIVT